MILSKDKEIQLQSNTIFEGYDAKISEEDIHKLWSMLQSPYKNSIGAIVREITSNCFDSHSEANVTDAVHVKIGKDDTGHYWSAEDFGVGLSPERIENVFINYLKSTKENSNNQIGCFGMGSKSPLSYTDWFSIRTRFDGIEYTYILRKGERTPRLEKIFEEPTVERNGTLIKIYIKENKSKWYPYNMEPEIARFKEECKNQLCYFDNIYFDSCDIDNDYKIIEGKHWKYNTHIKPFRGLHLVIGSVGYPIDWNNLKVDKIDFPVALKFDIGELDIIQTREDVRYTPRTIDAILNKIELLKEEFKEIWNKQDFEIDNVFEYYKKKQYLDYNITFYEQQFDLSLLFDCDDLQYFTYKKLPNIHYDLASNFLFEYCTSRRLDKNGRSIKTNLNNDIVRLINNATWNNRCNIAPYYIEGETNSKINKYIKSFEDKDVFFIEKNRSIGLIQYKHYLKLKDIPKSQWRQTIKDYQTAMKAEIDNLCKFYKDVIIDPQWEADNKVVRKKLAKGKVIVQEIKIGQSDNRKELDISTVSNRCLLVDVKENKEKLLQFADLFGKRIKDNGRGLYRVYSLTTAKSNLKLFKELKNVWTVETIMSEECKVFTRTCTAYKLKQEYSILLNIKWEHYIDIYKPIAEKLKEIQEFVNKWGEHEKKLTEFIKTTCLPIAKEKYLYDKDILNKINELSTYFEGLEILNYVKPKIVFEELTPNKLTEKEVFPTAEVVNYIYNYNKINKNKHKFKRLNAYYYCTFNQQELNWLKENKEEYKFQQSKLKLVS